MKLTIEHKKDGYHIRGPTKELIFHSLSEALAYIRGFFLPDEQSK
jgi:hypothetical protein